VRWLRGGASAALVFALLWAFLEAHVVDGLPGYPAALIVQLAFFVVPGFVICEALLPRTYGDTIERFVLAFTMGLALTAPAGLLALFAHLSLDGFIGWHIAVATAGAAIAGYLSRPELPSWPARSLRFWNAPSLVLLLLAAVAVAGILTSPSWAAGRTARNFDDWRYMTYVNSYLQEDKIEPLHPVGIGEAAYPRMAINVWMVDQAATAKASGVSAEQIVMDDMTPLLAVLALAATYTLAKGLFRSRGIALLAALLLLGIGLTDLSRAEGFGHGLLLRSAEDKFVATNIMLPLGMLFATMFVSRPRIDSMLTFALIGLAMFIVHPQPLIFVGITVFAFGFVRAITNHSLRPFGWVMLLAVPLGIFTLGEFVCWHLFNRSWPTFFGTTLTFRETLRIVHLPGHMIMGNYHLVTYPLMIGAIAVVPFLFLRGRRIAAHQMMLAATLGWLPFFFIPPLTTAMAKVASTELTARLPEVAPMAVVLAYGIYAAGHGARRHAPSIGAFRGPARLVAPALLGALLLAAGLAIQDSYYPLDKGAYFTWSSAHTIVPGSEHSIFLGGKDRLLSSEWRLGSDQRQLFEYLDTHAKPGSKVLLPVDLGLYMPGVAWNVKPAFSEGIIGQWQQPPAQGFYSGQLAPAALRRDLADAKIDYVVVKEVSDAGQEMSALPSAELVSGFGPYLLFAIHASS
jgi:hypothetical protein